MTEASRSTVIPALRYEKAREAIDFLCNAFGFERHAVYEGKDGSILHAELIHGGGMIMLSSASPGEWDRFVKTPRVAGTTTVSPCVIVADADAHYDRVVAAGAKILRPIQDESYGG